MALSSSHVVWRGAWAVEPFVGPALPSPAWKPRGLQILCKPKGRGPTLGDPAGLAAWAGLGQPQCVDCPHSKAEARGRMLGHPGRTRDGGSSGHFSATPSVQAVAGTSAGPSWLLRGILSCSPGGSDPRPEPSRRGLVPQLCVRRVRAGGSEEQRQLTQQVSSLRAAGPSPRRTSSGWPHVASGACRGTPWTGAPFALGTSLSFVLTLLLRAPGIRTMAPGVKVGACPPPAACQTPSVGVCPPPTVC